MARPVKSLRSRTAVLGDSDLFFSDAFENAPHAMALVGADGTMLSVNRALCLMLGYDRNALVDRNVGAITHPDDLLTEWEQRQRLARADIGRYELVQRYLRENGEPLWVRLSVSATRRPSSQLAHFIVQAEAVAAPRCVALDDDADAQWLRRFGDATLSAIHEIGNTLTPLMMNTELIVEQSRNEPIREFAHEVFKAARRIAFTLRRLRRIDDDQPVAYLGEDRMLDLRLVAPDPQRRDGEQPNDLSLDSDDEPHQN
ncbi:MAG TPA: PAS domain S-box protein [Gemmatimonadaceae bacterium]|nr:PAS domain S-box protein [Gemmatimonadaceae bacterium]